MPAPAPGLHQLREMQGWFGGRLFLAISNLLAKLVTNWSLFIDQEADVLEAYGSRKLREIRLVATVFLVVGGGLIIGGLVGWSLGPP